MKVLVMVNGHSLAHVSRPLEVCKELRNRGHEIVFSGGGKYLNIVTEFGFSFIETPYIDPENMQRALKQNKFSEIYVLKDLEVFLEADLALIKSEKPDLILNDCRVTARTAGEICQIPVIAIANTHMTNQRQVPFFDIENWCPSLPRTLINSINRLENRLELYFFHKLMYSQLVTLRKQRNLSSLFSYDLEGGDLFLIPDIPEFNPLNEHPDYHFVGPLTWKNTLPEPECLSMIDSKRPLVYLSIGSYSLDSILSNPKCLESDELQFIVSAGKDIDTDSIPRSRNVFIEKFVNVDKVLPFCNLVVCHGGNGTIYQALSYGIPILGFATHAEQAYGLRRLESLGLGKHIAASHLFREGPSKLITLSSAALNQTTTIEQRRYWQKLIERWNGRLMSADIIESYMIKRAPYKLSLAG